MAVLGCQWINVEVKVLVKVDIARGDVMEHGRVPLAISDPAIGQTAVGTRHESVVGIVLDLEPKFNVLVLRITNCVVIFEGRHGYTTKEIG